MATLLSKRGLDALVLADIREADAAECAAIGLLPAEVIARSANVSEEFFTVYDGTIPLAVWGYSRKTVLGNTAEVWLMSTHAVEGCKKSFAMESRRVVERLLETFAVLEVYVHKDYRRAFNWLGWLGFVPEGSAGEFHVMRCYRGMH